MPSTIPSAITASSGSSDQNTAKGKSAANGSQRHWFRRFANATSQAMGSPWAFVIATLSLIVWAFSHPLFKSADTWQLVINTATTIVTFLMVFLIQNTQNRDAKAIHLKLDELIRGVKGARTRLVDLEELSDEELDALQKEFARLREREAKRREKKPQMNKE